MNKSIKDMEDWNQSFGNGFATGLVSLFIIATIMLFFGCEISLKTEEAVQEDKAEEDSTGSEPSATKFNAEDWILFK